MKLHLDGIVKVAGKVPTSSMTRMREERTRTGDIFLGLGGIDCVFDLVRFAWDGKDTYAMHGAGCGSERGKGEAEVVPGKIQEICDRYDGKRSEKGATEKFHCRRASGEKRIRHGFSLQAMGNKWDPRRGVRGKAQKTRKDAVVGNRRRRQEANVWQGLGLEME